MAKQYQEFYCASSGGGCGGYFVIKLNMALNQNIEVKCPSCGHLHHRKIKDGLLYDQGMGWRHEGADVIIVPMSAYHKEPIVKGHTSRSAIKLDNNRGAPPISPEVKQRWLERFGLR